MAHAGIIPDGSGVPTGTPLSDPPLVEMISEDPVLRTTKLIAEAWDCDGLFQVPDSSWLAVLCCFTHLTHACMMLLLDQRGRPSMHVCCILASLSCEIQAGCSRVCI
jgi:hypothetical protein